MTIEAMKQALEVLEDFVDDPRAQHQIDAASAVLRQAIAEAEKQEPPPECQTEAEKTAFAFGWWKATEAQRAEKQEPVAWQVHPFDYGIGHEGVYARTDRLEQVEAWKRKGWNVQPLYTHPQPQREWVGLTDEEVRQMCGSVPSMKDAVREAEAKLKAKNFA
jgi:hypothetical protein